MYYPMLVLDSREQWLTGEQDKGVCSNCTEIQQLTEGLGTPLFSTSLLYFILKAGKAREENWKNKLLTDIKQQKFLRLSLFARSAYLHVEEMSEKAPQQVLSHCLPLKQPWPRYNMTPQSRATCHPRRCRGFLCKYFSIAWLILWTGTNSSYARGWNTSLTNSVPDLLQQTFCLHTKLPPLLVNPFSSLELSGPV